MNSSFEKKSLAVIVICLMMLMSLPVVMGSNEHFVENLDGNILYVGGNGPGNYTTIQDAVDAASEGDTIFVYSGTYYENVKVEKTVILNGEDSGKVVIDGYGKDAIKIDAQNVTLSDFTIRNGKSGTYANGISLHKNSKNTLVVNNTITKCRNGKGIFIDSNCENSVISNNIFANCHQGIWIDSGRISIKNNEIASTEWWEWSICIGTGVDEVVIENNSIFGDGIIVFSSENSTFKNNTIVNKDYGGHSGYYSACGINLWSCRNNTIISNDFQNSGIFIHGDEEHFWSSHIISDNIANNRSICYYKNENGRSFGGILDPAQIILANCSDCMVHNIDMNHMSIGVQLGFSNNNIIAENVIAHAEGGIYLESSDNNLIKNNCVINMSGIGIWVRSSSYNLICGNTIRKNTHSGIFQQQDSTNNEINNNSLMENGNGLDFCEACFTTVTNNTIQDNGVGVNLRVCTDGTVTTNTIENNQIGINFRFCSDSNVFKNTIKDNENGIDFGNCSDCSVQCNNFLQNSIQAVDTAVDNLWDANYWDNWIGLKLPLFDFFPYLIRGVFLSNFDWNPASEPYEINGGII